MRILINEQLFIFSVGLYFVHIVTAVVCTQGCTWLNVLELSYPEPTAGFVLLKCEINEVARAVECRAHQL